MGEWRLAKSLITLRDQINKKFPSRSKENDGSIGDERHQASKSEHNPDANGVVRAIDITNDPANHLNSRHVAETLINSRDPRILYLISNGEICSSQVSPWKWRKYTGSNQHFHHFHISVLPDPKLYDNIKEWKI